MEPKPVDGIDLAFGGRVSELLPPFKDIPDEFWHYPHRTKWGEIVSRWFFRGLPKDTEFVPKAGIDGKMALRHISACMRSWEPKHEHKEAGCAYLLSLWFDDVIIPENTKPTQPQRSEQ